MPLTRQETAELEALRQARGVTAPVEETPPETSLQNIPEIPTTTGLLKEYVIDPLTSRLPENIISSLPDIGESGGELAGFAEGVRRGAQMPGGPAVKAGSAAIFGTLGAMSGTFIGENLRQIFQQENDPAKAIQKTLESGIFSSAGEIVSLLGFAGRGIEKLRNNQQLTAEEIQSLDQLQKGLTEQGISLTPAQLTNSTFQNTLEKVAISGFGGEAKFAALYEAQEQFIKDELNRLVKQTGNPDRKLTGQMFQDALENAEDDLIKWAEPKYKELNKLARDQRLSMQSTEQTLRNAQKRAMVDRKLGQKPRLDPEVAEMYDYVLGNTRNLSYQSLFDTISDLTKRQRKVTSRIDNRNPELEKAYRDTIESLLEDGRKAAKESGNQVILDKYNEVTDVYRETLTTLNDKSLKGIVDTQPEFVGSEIYRTGNVSTVEAAFKAVDEAKASAERLGKEFDAEQIKNNIRAGYLRQLFQRSEIAETSTESASRTLREIAANDEVGDTFNAVLTPKMQAEVKRVLGWGSTLEKQSAGNFSLIVRGRQSGSLNKVANEVGDAGAGIGFNPLVLGTAATMVSSPLFLANRAINGKVTTENLKQMKDFVRRYDQSKLDASDISSFFLLLANDASESDEIPIELRVPNLSPKETFEYHAIKAQRLQRERQITRQAPVTP